MVELIVYIVIFTVIASVLASIFIGLWRAQGSVTSQTTATNRGQLVAASVEKAVRNGEWFDIVDASSSTVVIETALGGSLKCQGFSLAGGKVRTINSASKLPSDPSTWGQWQSGVVQHGAQPFFTKSGTALGYAFDLTSSSSVIHFSGSAYMRTSGSGVTTCW